MYLRTSRLDLDDYNNEVAEGLHITSMGGTWMSIVYGFGGMKIREGLLSFDPILPEKWEALSFKIMFRGSTLNVSIEKRRVTIENLEGPELKVYLRDSKLELKSAGKLVRKS